MSIVETVYDFHNPRNPKCRACQFYGDTQEEFRTGSKCTCPDFKGSRDRWHNSKACRQFTLRRLEKADEQN